MNPENRPSQKRVLQTLVCLTEEIAFTTSSEGKHHAGSLVCIPSFAVQQFVRLGPAGCLEKEFAQGAGKNVLAEDLTAGRVVLYCRIGYGAAGQGVTVSAVKPESESARAIPLVRTITDTG